MTQHEESAQPEVLRRSYWVCSGPLFETTAFIIPAVQMDAETGKPTPASEVSPFSLSFMILDSDGHVVSESQISISRFGPTLLELSQFMEALKMEEGLRHGTLIIEGSPGWECEVRLHSVKSAAFMAPVMSLSEASGSFLPISISPERTQLAIVTNSSGQEAKVRCRFYLGKRSPEHTLIIPPRGVRVLGVQAVFAEYIEALEGEPSQSYLRLTTRGESELGVQLIERTASKRETGIFGVIG